MAKLDQCRHGGDDKTIPYIPFTEVVRVPNNTPEANITGLILES